MTKNAQAVATRLKRKFPLEIIFKLMNESRERDFRRFVMRLSVDSLDPLPCVADANTVVAVPSGESRTLFEEEFESGEVSSIQTIDRTMRFSWLGNYQPQYIKNSLLFWHLSSYG